jgi:RimJ/RimL family protein N-acetyltransferase
VVHTCLGDARPLDELEREMPAVPGRRPGSFAVEHDRTMTGRIPLRRVTEHHCPSAVGRIDLGCLFPPHAWGHGYAREACSAALDRLDGPGEPVALATQPADTASLRLAARLGFAGAERFCAWDADQWLGLRPAPGAHR